MKKELNLQISNEIILKGYIYEPEVESKGVIQICHGMAEHIERYDEFMNFLSNNGYTVIGYDQRGHGKTAGSVENCGYMDDLNNIEVLVSFSVSSTTSIPLVHPTKQQQIKVIIINKIKSFFITYSPQNK